MTQPFSTPVEDTVPKVDAAIAVGEDLAFQRRWWRFERLIWAFFTVLIACDLLGLFGDGWLARARASVPDGSLSIDYERIERATTPSAMVLHFGPGAVRQGHVRVFVSDAIVRDLGAQRIAPQPAVSAIGEHGISYDFPATAGPAEVQIGLEPSAAGLYRFRVQAAGEPPLDKRVLVLP